MIDDSIADAVSFHTKIVGVTFEGRQAVVSSLYEGEALQLEREPNNAFDKKAVAVYSRTRQVGYLSRDIAEYIAVRMDGGVTYACTVENLTGGENGKALGVNIFVYRV